MRSKPPPNWATVDIRRRGIGPDTTSEDGYTLRRGLTAEALFAERVATYLRTTPPRTHEDVEALADRNVSAAERWRASRHGASGASLREILEACDD